MDKDEFDSGVDWQDKQSLSDSESEGTSESMQGLRPPEDATTVAVKKNGNIIKYEFYQFENPKEFFGDAWGDQFEMEKKISESDKTPDQIIDNIKWEIEFPTLSLR